MQESFAIVVIAYNRLDSLERLLVSLNNLIITNPLAITLVISIDKGENENVCRLAERFVWKYGEKVIIKREKKLGLKEHVFSCMSLSEKYQNVVLLEDDCFLSPFAYDFMNQSIATYKEEEQICGISLYSYDYNEFAGMPFMPIQDGYDNYFMQVPSSLGLIVSRRMWMQFNESYKKGLTELEPQDKIHDKVYLWKKSWKKSFLKYMVSGNKYFVYPRISLSTNFCDAGTNYSSDVNNYQVSILMGEKKYIFSNITQSKAAYDSFYEYRPINTSEYSDVEFDLYGQKNVLKYGRQLFFTVKPILDKPVKSVGSKMLPHELNVLYEVPGNYFNLILATKILQKLENSKTIKSVFYEKINTNIISRKASQEIEQVIKNSFTYRIGNVITFIPRTLRDMLKKIHT